MSRKAFLLSAALVLIAISAFLALGGFQAFSSTSPLTSAAPESEYSNVGSPGTITIASWNLQGFGKRRAFDPELMDYYAGVMKKYDIILMQGIRDEREAAFKKLCSMLDGYSCLVSSRAGFNLTKEQYAVFYRNAVFLGAQDWNFGSHAEQFNWPPYTVRFKAGNWTFQVTTMKADQRNVSGELAALEDILAFQAYPGDEIIMGDLSADCDRYSTPPSDFRRWRWVLPDSQDTTVSKETLCAFDRILINNYTFNNYVSYDVMRDMTENQSGHYLIYATFKMTEP